MGRPKLDDPKKPVTIYVRASAIERMSRRPDWKAELVASLEAKYGERREVSPRFKGG